MNISVHEAGITSDGELYCKHCGHWIDLMPENKPQLPGSQGNKPNPPPLVGSNINPADRAKYEALWADLVALKQALAEIMAVFEAHPELRGIVTGQGKTPP